jgi:hypothetical protein
MLHGRESPRAEFWRRTVRQKTRPGRCPEQELIALRTWMLNQAREVFYHGTFPASLIYVLIVSPMARGPVDSYAASLS